MKTTSKHRCLIVYVIAFFTLLGISLAVSPGIEELLEKFPSHSTLPWFLQTKARSQVWMKDPNSADATVAAMRQQCAANPDYADAMSWTAYEYHRAGYYQQAIEINEALLSQNLDIKVHVRSIASIALSYARLGKDTQVHEKVEQLLSQYSPIYPDGVEFYIFDIGEEYYLSAEDATKTNDPNQIVASYQKALAVWQQFEQAISNHNSPQYAYFSAIVCHRLRQYEQAVVHFQRVINKWPDFKHTWRARYILADCIQSLANTGKMDISQADMVKRTLYREILQKNPDCPVVNMINLQLNDVNQ